MTTKQERLEIVNNIIKKIASLDRKFFYSAKNDMTAYMFFKNGRLYFKDDYTKQDIYAYAYKYFGAFSHGGTLQALILDFSKYIRTGKNYNGENGYGGLNCRHWGYSAESMKAIQSYAMELGYLEGRLCYICEKPILQNDPFDKVPSGHEYIIVHSSCLPDCEEEEYDDGY
ncbi:hypothetical protein [Listeria booriae]|uniref:hypothetical protein n=1 Tax=Listeria booriae TaxID=1552123 RepID=UPI001627A373|nr:hypothetical protein [Listeria booriae]MBC1290604.1 hypothetical protein [Listeria booriae]